MALNITNAQRAEILTQALPYIRKYYGETIVVKYGGNAMINADLKQQVMEDIVLMSLIGVKVVLVHGGGPEITEMLEKIGKKSEFVDGLRVTDKETADIVQMVLAGKINKSLVNYLEIKGGRAVGLSGMDGHMLTAEKKDNRLGVVGKITHVDVTPVTDLLEKANLPLEGLSVEDGELTYKGFKWDNLSGADQMKVGVAIVRRLNPNCGFVLLDKLEQMDLDTLDEFGRWLRQEDLQVIATRVSTGDECAIIIEDGYSKANEKADVAAPQWKAGEF